MKQLTPKEIMEELDRFIIGQNKAKKAVSVALRNGRADDTLRPCREVPRTSS